MTIAVLGWGSLIWDPRELQLADFAWHLDGPKLPIEFARISEADPKTGLPRLTLVLHEGSPEIPTLWALSAHSELSEACANLGRRERREEGAVGYVHRDGQRHLTAITDATVRKKLLETIDRWREQMDFDAVIWTDLPCKGFTPFTIQKAVERLREWHQNGIATDAQKYVRCAPAQIRTAVRDRVERELQWLPMIRVPQPAIAATNKPDGWILAEPIGELDLESARALLPELDQAINSEFVSYSQLVRAKWGMEDPLPTEDPPPSKALQAANWTLYPSVLKVFQASHGTIIDDYCHKVIRSGVARTSPHDKGDPTHVPDRARQRTPERARKHDFHFVYDLSTVPIGDDLLSRIDMLAADASRLLNGQRLINCLDQLYSKATDLLGIVEEEINRRANGGKHTPLSAIGPSRDLEGSNKHKVGLIEQDLNVIEKNYLLTQARLDYFRGAVACAFAVVLLVLLGYGVAKFDWLVPGLALVLVLGTLGAFLSVVQRLGNDSLNVRYDLGRGYTIFLGFTRPLIGAFVGLLLWILVEAKIVANPTGSIFFLGALALAFGVAERTVGDIVTQTGVLGRLPTGSSREASRGSTARSGG